MLTSAARRRCQGFSSRQTLVMSTKSCPTGPILWQVKDKVRASNTTQVAKLGESTGKTRVLYSELGEITGKTRVLPRGNPKLSLFSFYSIQKVAGKFPAIQISLIFMIET